MNDLTPLDVDVFVDIDVGVDVDDGYGDGPWLPWQQPWSVHWSQVEPSANPELRNQSIPNAGRRKFVHILKTMSTFRSSNRGLQSSWRSARDRRYFFFSKTDSTCSKYINEDDANILIWPWESFVYGIPLQTCPICLVEYSLWRGVQKQPGNIAKGTTDPRVEFTWGYITSSNTNLNQISSSESRLRINFSTKHQHLQ